MRLNLHKLVVSITACIAVGVVGSVFTTPAITSWYLTLNKPFFSPPNWIFAPVWTLLYILMGVSLYFLFSSRKKGKDKAIKLFLIQLALNFFWSMIFFGLHNPLAAFAEIISLWIFILLTIKQSYAVSKTAANLMLPYIAWVSFATILNLYIAILN